MNIETQNKIARAAVLAVVCVVSAAIGVQAGPRGMTVVAGSAHSTQNGNTLQINTSRNAILQWQSFNIGVGETTIFNQPSATSVVINEIGGASPSSIYGSLRANGIVVLQNPQGFYFGPNAFVKAGGLVVTTAAINPWGSGNGAGWSFDGPPPSVPIVNYGHLETASGGSLFLIAKEIDNHGTVTAPGGTAALLAGQDVLLASGPNGLSLSEPVHLPAGSVNNDGQIMADAGQIVLQAQNVNNSGVVQANSVREHNGVIEFYASQDINLSGTSLIQANGDDSGASPGGNIVLKAGGTFSDTLGSQITATGGSSGGNGGNVEVSAPSFLSLNSVINAGARTGWSEGNFSLDPQNIEIGTSGSTSGGASGVVNATGSSGTVMVDIRSAFDNITANILLEASGNITMDPGTVWNLSATTGRNSGQLTLEAGGNITLGTTSAGQPAAVISDANNWSVTLEAGYNFNTGQVTPGTGNVTLASTSASSGSSIQTATGNINVIAGQNVTVGTGGIVTGVANGSVIAGNGGSINVQALSGNVDGGNSRNGFNFKSGVLGTVDPALGGISTAAGGNVNIQAGGNITDEPVLSFNEDAGIGAFGAEPGNVTLSAGGNVTGHYVLANGTGIINGANAGTAGANLALSLVKGSWSVNAVNNIVLQEVRNPDGIFNSQLSELFNYDPLAAVYLNAGQGVTITGASLPRVSRTEPMIFPPSLSIDAGSGGITLNANVNLFPSPEGTLNLTTTGGGNLQANGDTINISDSPRTSFSSASAFSSGDSQANALLHLNDPNPVLVNISGSVNNLLLISPKPVELFAAGNIVDSSLNIMNLHPSDVSTISAGGEIIQHDAFTILTLPAGVTPNFGALDEFAPSQISTPGGLAPNPNVIPIIADFQNKFVYDPTTHSLLFNSSTPMTTAQEAALLSIHFLDQADLDHIQSQSQNVPTVEHGAYTISGPGTLRINAASMVMGDDGFVVSGGITGATGVGQLAPYTARGADIDISVAGDLSMLAAAIESEYGGNINITCGGSMDIGQPLLQSVLAQEELSGGHTFGITTVWGGNVNVIANGDINVDSSRIAAYDGGNIFVESLNGNVNAGKGGGLGSVKVAKPYINAQGAVNTLIEQIPGSGILATSFPQLVPGETAFAIGNITVETPRGNIEASQGGISQLVLGPVNGNSGTINLSAGSKNADGSVAFVGDVDASGSGVVGGQVNISATGNINGLVVASVGANVSALQNISATVLSQGGVTVSAGGTASGTIVGVGGVSVSASVDVAAAFSSTGSVAASGNIGGAATPAAAAGSNSASAAATGNAVTQAAQGGDLTSNNDDEELKKKKAAATRLMEYVGRVTVLLPQ